MLADEIVIRAVIHVGLARGHRVEDLEGADQFAGRLQIDGQLAVGHRGDGVGDALGCVMHPGKAAAPGGDQRQRALALGVQAVRPASVAAAAAVPPTAAFVRNERRSIGFSLPG